VLIAVYLELYLEPQATSQSWSFECFCTWRTQQYYMAHEIVRHTIRPSFLLRWQDAPPTTKTTYQSRGFLERKVCDYDLMNECYCFCCDNNLTMNFTVSTSSFVLPILYSIPDAACPTYKRASRGLDPIDVRPDLDSIRAGRE
jgi:hypothetical protein